MEHMQAARAIEPREGVPPFEEVHRRHYDMVWRNLGRLGVPPAVIDDAAQDVFLTVHRTMARLEDPERLRSWIYGITRRVAFRYRRSGSRNRRKLDALGVLAPQSSTSEEEISRREAARIVEEFVGSLSEEQRQVFVLHVLEGFSGPEVAAALDLSVNTVHSRLRLVRARFSRLCERFEIEERRAAGLARGPAADPGRQRRAWGLMLPLLASPGSSMPAAGWLSRFDMFVMTVVVGVGSLVLIRAHDLGASQHLGGSLAPTVAPVVGHPTSERAVLPEVPVPEVVVSEPVTPPSVELTTPESKPEHARRVRKRRHDPDDALARETRLMLEIRGAMRTGDFGRALTLIEGDGSAFSRGSFVVQREAYRIVAMCELGRVQDGRTLARGFVREHASSSLSEYVCKACGI